jgi:diadenosine tetraphosphate (Ap4A) HIT family hydrolase
VAEGVDVRQNYRPFLAPSKLKVDHVHFHVLPRTNEDELYQKSMKHEADLFAELTTTEKRRFIELLGS